MLRQIHWKPLSSGTDSLEASQQWDRFTGSLSAVGQIHWKPLSSGTDSLEASQQWDPASLGETTTRDYQVQVYFIYKTVSCDDETMIIYFSTYLPSILCLPFTHSCYHVQGFKS